jgi:release factor glutamine methyltransferase
VKIIDIFKLQNKEKIEIAKEIFKDAYANANYTLKPSERKKINTYFKRLDKKEPIEYILKKANFYGRTLFVNKNVLIPRVETESIIPYLLKFDSVIDIGTGSGAVGVTIKKEIPDINVLISDISLKAIYVAKKNVQGMDIKIIRTDLTNKIPINEYKCIFANLPYISNMDSLDMSVKDYEPHIALDGGKDGIEIILRLIQELYTKKWKGTLLLEMDPQQISLIKEKKKIIKDQFGYNRFVQIDY